MKTKDTQNDDLILDDDDELYDDYEDDDGYEDDDEYYNTQDLSEQEVDDDDNYDEDDEDDDEYEDDEDDEPKPKRRRKKKKIKGLKLSFALIMIFIILGITALLSISIIFMAKEYLGVGKSSTTYIVEVPEGASTDDIIDILYDDNIIQIKELFKLCVKVNDDGRPLISGEHEISPSMDYGDIIDELKTNIEESKETVMVTLPEGINVYDAGTLLEEAGVCDARNFVYYFKGGFNLSGYTFAEHLPEESALKFIKLEGYLFPDTYEFYKDEDPEIVCRKIFDNFDRKITQEYYDRMNQMNMTLDEVITLASIIQKEAGDIENMKKISSVFHNRLNNPDKFPKLESDPTRIYAEDVIHVKADITDETIENAYNTYQSAGLPPGAICNPGLEAINATLYPDDTEYFYFCANVNTGKVYYATTLEEHEANLELSTSETDEEDTQSDEE